MGGWGQLYLWFDDADGEQEVGVDALFGGGDGENGVVFSGIVVEFESLLLGEVEVVGEDSSEVGEDGLVFHGVRGHDGGLFDGDGGHEGVEDVGDGDEARSEVEEDVLGSGG